MTKIPFLKGKNIFLRQLNERDLDGDYINWFNDPEVCKYNSHHIFPYSREKAAEYLNKINDSKTNLVLAMVLIKNNSHIGNVSLQEINFINRSAEFAVIIGDKKSWGKGYSKEAARLVLEHGFLQLNLHRIYCGTSIENVPMQKLAISLGMTKEGYQRQALFKNGKYLDILEFGILKKEFLDKNNI
jgi:RimJ/RimL family protein N-acetyltransferase